MAEYLELEKVLDDKNIITVQTREYGSIEVIPVDTITDIELADVQSAKRGKWVAENRDNRGYADCFTCSNCQSYTYTYTLMRDCEYDYCPNCGAKMDLPEAIKG